MTGMVFAFLCFTGIFVMFFYLMRSLEKFQEQMRDEHAHLRVQIRALEARLDILTGAATTPAPPPPRTPLSENPPASLTLVPKNPQDAAPENPLILFEPGK
jgi:hypothetical protein